MPLLQRITIFPIKSLDGHELDRADVLPSGALAGDRRYALKDRSGRFVNGKRCAAIHGIRARFSDDLQSVVLSSGRNTQTFALEPESQLLAEWCSDLLGMNCRFVENTEFGFPDDSQAPGPTLISTASLWEVTSWFEYLELEEARRRFRMNLEIDAPTPFWEDRLVTARSKIRRFRIGLTSWQGRGVCQRCVVPTRDSREGTVSPGFAHAFARLRQETLPAWATTERFDHFYRLGVNMALDEITSGAVLQVGDPLEPVDQTSPEN